MISRLFQMSVIVLSAHVGRWWRTHLLLIGIVVVFGLVFYGFLVAPLPDFPKGRVMQIEYGTSLPEIARTFREAKLIRSELVLKCFVRLLGGSHSIDAGTYRFDESQSTAVIAYRLIQGEYGMPEVRLTFPEGLTVREMSRLVAEAYTEDFGSEFLTEAKQYEGFLFPDTYHFSGADTPQTIVKHMRDVFGEKTSALRDQIRSSGHSLEETVTMASLLEREANTLEDQKIVSGILWRRLAIGMPLQVDAVFAYILNKPGYAPTLDDLKIESPFNTYLYKGLPPTPIGNPGESALRAALEPTKTPYLFYLTGNDGAMYYAKTFAEHGRNIERYLK